MHSVRRPFVPALIIAAGLFAPLAVTGAAQQGKQGQDAKQRDTESVTVVGCLSADQKNGIILTADPGDLTSGVSQRTSGTVPSVTYQLVGGDRQKLAGLVGRRAEIRGRTTEEPAAEAKTTSKTEHSPRGTSGKTPKVETTTKAKIEVRKLDVASVQPVQGDCPAARTGK